MTFALGQTCNAEPISLAIALVRMGARVAEIFTDPSPAQKKQLALLAKLSPNTRISSNLSPSMLFYKPNTSEVTISIGRDACYYHNDCPGIPFCDDAQPFGYRGLIHLLAAIRNAL